MTVSRARAGGLPLPRCGGSKVPEPLISLGSCDAVVPSLVPNEGAIASLIDRVFSRKRGMMRFDTPREAFYCPK